jgi:membrane protein DedA with SNARE-associated domain
VPGVGISGFCGVVRYPFKKFIIITCLGAAIRAFLLGMVGWQVGSLYAEYAELVSKFEKYILVILFLSLVLFFASRYVLKSKP